MVAGSPARAVAMTGVAMAATPVAATAVTPVEAIVVRAVRRDAAANSRDANRDSGGTLSQARFVNADMNAASAIADMLYDRWISRLSSIRAAID